MIGRELRCPECDIDAMEHEGSFCLERWINAVIFGGGEIAINCYSFNDDAALRLMQKVWALDSTATIGKDNIGLRHTQMGPWEIIEGGTFPLRVCRAALWLAQYEKMKTER